MGLSELAAGIEVRAEQDERGVAAVDATDRSLAERFAEAAEQLPCTPEAAATVVRAQTKGVSVERAAREAGVAPITAAKALHRCGVRGVIPVGPTGREVVRDWLAGELSRHEAETLAGCSEAEFALAAYCESHDPVPALEAAVADAFAPDESSSVAKRDRLAETMSSVSELR
ncbi:MAG: hypothetical protein ABEI75_02805 [Halobaculum sp.]